MLQNASTLAIAAVHQEENEPPQVWKLKLVQHLAEASAPDPELTSIAIKVFYTSMASEYELSGIFASTESLILFGNCIRR